MMSSDDYDTIVNKYSPHLIIYHFICRLLDIQRGKTKPHLHLHFTFI